jgi:serine/threonine protein kinase
LKLENILISSKNKAKVSNFGLSMHYSSFACKIAGSLLYLEPKIIKKKLFF